MNSSPLPVIQRGLSIGLLTLAFSILPACDSNDGKGVALGLIERERIALTATADEIIIELPVKEGTVVKKGQLLVQLDPREQKALLEKAAADIAEKQATLTKLRNGARREDVAAAQAKLRDAEANLIYERKTYERYKDLLARNITSQSKYDQALDNRNKALPSLDNARQELLKLTNGTRPEDLQFAVAQLDAAKAVHAVEKQRLDELSVVATRDGKLDNLPWNLGERVSKGTPVAVMLSDAVPYVHAYIPESHRAKVETGTQLQINIDGMDQPFTGVVKWISNESAFTPYYALNAEERARLVYLAEISLPESAAALPTGLPAEVILP